MTSLLVLLGTNSVSELIGAGLWQVENPLVSRVVPITWFLGESKPARVVDSLVHFLLGLSC